MKLTVRDINELEYAAINEDYTDELRLVDRVIETEGNSIVKTAILKDKEDRLYSCYMAESFDDHGNRCTYFSSQSCKISAELYDGDFMDGSWKTEIELTEVTRKEVVKVVYEVK